MTATNRISFGIPVLRLCAVAPASATASGAMRGNLSLQAVAGCFGGQAGMNTPNEGGRHSAGGRAM